jgi:hypothetical protein
MDHVFLLLLVGTTSAAALLIGTRGLHLPRARLAAGFQRALELLGVSVLFFVVNLVVGLAVILAVRALTKQFLSAYLLNDMGLMVLSVVQGIVFECWRRS